MPIIAWFEAVLKLSLSVLFLQFFDIGGVALGTFLGSLLSVFWITPILLIKRSNYKLKYNKVFIQKHFSFVLLPLLILAIADQLFVDTLSIRILIGVVVMLLYISLSYKLLSDEERFFLKNLLKLS